MDVWRSALLINDECRTGRFWLDNPYRIHQRLLMAFEDGIAGRLMWRPEAQAVKIRTIEFAAGARWISTREGERTVLIVQAEHRANWARGFEGLPILIRAAQEQVKLVAAEGDVLSYRLRAAPMKCRPTQPGQRSRRMWLNHPEEWSAWLERKADMHGFQLETTCIGPSETIAAVRSKEERPQMLLAVEFSGRLRVTDAERFAQAVARGIGPGKAYGCGLLLPKRIEQEG